MLDKIINIAVFGVGRIGVIHLQNLHNNSLVNLVAICDPFAENIEQLSKKFNVDIKAQDEIFADDNINTVVVASATNTHADLVEAAIKSNKNIFCEKPIDLDINRILGIYKLTQNTNIKIGVGFQRRHDINFIKLKQAIKQKEIGNIETISIISKDSYPPPTSYIKSSGGLVRDMMIHDLDMFNFLIDDEIVEIYAQGSNLISAEIKEVGDIDTAQVCIKTKKGILGNITNSRRCLYGYDQRIEVFGSKGKLNVDNIPNNFLKITNENNACSSSYLNFFMERYMNAYQTEIDSFIDYLQGRGEYRANLADAVKASKLAEMVVLSIDTKSNITMDEYEKNL